jgi:hypothetical protein
MLVSAMEVFPVRASPAAGRISVRAHPFTSVEMVKIDRASGSSSGTTYFLAESFF